MSRTTLSRIFAVLTGALLLAAGGVANAEQSRSFGDYTIHYVAFTTDLLSTEVARLYKIRRSKNRAILNVSVLKKVLGATGKPVKAQVQATATNTNQQLKKLNVRELIREGAIYYIAEFVVNNEETLDFELHITPEGESVALSLQFRQQFFTE